MSLETSTYSGLSGSSLAYCLTKLIAGLAPEESWRGQTEAQDRTLVVVVPSTTFSEDLITDLEFFSGKKFPNYLTKFFPWEVLPFEALSPAQEISTERLHCLSKLALGRPSLVIVPAQALLQKLPQPKLVRDSVFELALGESLGRDELIERLDSCGYIRTSLVENPGEVAVRGAVVDFFPGGAEFPVRVELFSDVVDSIRTFDLDSQRSLDALSEISVFPVREFIVSSAESERAVNAVRARARELEIADRYVAPYLEAIQHGTFYPGLEQLQPIVSGGGASLLDYLPDNFKLILMEEISIQTALDDFSAVVDERESVMLERGEFHASRDSSFFSASSIWSQLKAKRSIVFNSLEVLSGPGEIDCYSNQLSFFGNSELSRAIQLGKGKEHPFAPLADDVNALIKKGVRVGIVVSQRSRARRFKQLLDSYGIEAEDFEGSFSDWCTVDSKSPVVKIFEGELSSGLRALDERFVLIQEAEIFPGASNRKKARTSLKNVRKFLGSVNQLQEADLIVHVEHGVGQYRGLKQLSVDGKTADFLYLEYADEAKLFLPVENIGKIQKYVGGDGKKPVLHKLGGKSWEKAKAKVKKSVEDIAGKLVSLYAARELAQGFNFGPKDEDDIAFADTFPFVETPDQERAIEEVLDDMGKSRPMDRLVCGDVGYGKTEVALRAAFKVANVGKQVAVLVPTTILADQHYATFKDRFANYPIEVRCVSRFFSSADNKATLQGLATGKVDIVIGTHRLLQRDVHIDNLGLVIIDEEHRFGVAHKEKLKNLRREVDMLTLTATPIPRTLHMSMVGIRDLSTIETAPSDRHAIRTYVSPYSDAIAREAILRELSRGGQVYYIHNRVMNIAAICDEVSQLVPEANVEFGHGQMKEKELEQVMHRFVSGKIDVLVCTTIVESGLDIPNANTIIFRKADAFGLAELYQLRGRVGRSSKRAYAYLLVSDPKTLGAEAKKRLQVLQSLDDLGMGFRLAIQDMEIRGAGNLLGKDQSGHVHEIGYELYSKILKGAVNELKARSGFEAAPSVPEVDPEIKIGFPAHIPPVYIPDVGERLVLYQRLVELRDDVHAREFAEEIEDRFGRMPAEVEVLVDVMTIRSLLRRYGVVSATYRGDSLTLAFHRDVKIDPEKIVSLVSQSGGHLKLSPDMVLRAKTGCVYDTPAELYRYTKGLLSEVCASS